MNMLIEVDADLALTAGLWGMLLGNFSKRLNNRVLTRGPSAGYCAICRLHEKLTRDHVPPKGCDNIRDVTLRTLVAHSLSGDNSQRSHSQGGTHFKTICEKCNSGLLGTEYDPHLIKLFNEVTALLKANSEIGIAIPPTSHHFAMTHRIARSVIGHVLAANSVNQVRGGRRSSPFYDALSEYFLDQRMDLPVDLTIFYWIYPYRPQIIARGVGKISLKWSGILFGDVIKFPPFGFWLLWKVPENLRIDLPLLVKNRSGGIDAMEQMVMDYRNIQRPDFPETPSTDEALMLSEEMTSVATVTLPA